MSERLTPEREAYIRNILTNHYPNLAGELFKELDAVRTENNGLRMSNAHLASERNEARNQLEGAKRHATRVERERDQARKELEQTDQCLIDFTGAPTIDEALQVIIAPVEWDALASFHGVTIDAGMPKDSDA